MGRSNKPKAETDDTKVRRKRATRGRSGATRAEAAEPAQTQASESYRRFLELSHEGIWRYDLDPPVPVDLSEREQAEAMLEHARLTECNDAFARLFGYESSNDLLGHPLGDILAGTREEQVQFIVHSIRSGYRITDMEALNQGRDGRTVRTLSNVWGVVEDGRLVCGFGTSRDITERQQVEDALRASEERLRLALDATSDGIYDVDFRTGRTYYSPRYVTMLEYSPGELLPSQETWEGLLHPDDKENALRVLNRCLAGETDEYEMEFRLRTKTGDWRWILSRGRVVERDPKGLPLRLVGTHRDITGRREIRDELRRERDRAESYLDAAEVILVALDKGGTVTLVNRAGRQILGYENGKDLIGKNWFDTAVPPSAVEATKAVFARLMAGQVEPVEYHENPVVTRSGETRLIAWHNTLLRDETGRIAGTLSSGEDITERRRAEEGLRQSEEKYRVLVENAGEAVFVAQDGFLKFANPSTARILGRSLEDIASRPFLEFIHPEDRGWVAERHRRRLAGDEVETGYAFRVLRTDGEARWVEINAVRIEWQGRPATLNFVSDITERRRAEEAVRDLARFPEENPSPVFRVKQDGTILYANPGSASFCKAWGLEVGKALPAAWQALAGEAVRSGEVKELDAERGGRVFSLTMAPVAASDYVNLYGLDVTERRLAERALKKSEERFRGLYEHATVGIYRTTPDGRILMVNPAAARMLGYDSPEELMERNLEETGYEPTYPRSEFRRRLEAEGVVTGMESAWTRKGGSTIRVRESARAVRGERGAIEYYDGTFEDITERKLAEEALQESEERFRRIFEEGPLGMVTTDARFRFTRVNAAFCRMLGYTEEELLSLTFQDVTHPDHVGIDTEAVKKLVRGEIPLYQTEKRYVRKDERIVWGAVTVALIRNPEGQFLYSLAMIEDITARKNADIALVESERRYRELANALPSCVFEADLNGVLSFANRTGFEWFGYSEEELLAGKSVLDMIALEDRERAARTFRRVALSGEISSGEYLARREDGSTFPALVSSRAIVRDGHTVGLRGIVVDITERREAALRLEKALQGTIRALAVTTETRDPYTAGHQERVMMLACAIGKEMGLPEDLINGLRVAGLLHDIGKVCVPAEILSKPTSLTPAEFSLVKEHPETGYAILKAIEFPWPVADVVLQHHERLDGSGYPGGLRGDAIQIEARILAVADTVEAMASHRPYRPALGMNEALAAIKEGRGTLYDEAAVDACVRLIAERGFRFED